MAVSLCCVRVYEGDDVANNSWLRRRRTSAFANKGPTAGRQAETANSIGVKFFIRLQVRQNLILLKRRRNIYYENKIVSLEFGISKKGIYEKNVKPWRSQQSGR